MNSSIENERDPSHVNPTSSPRGNPFLLKKTHWKAYGMEQSYLYNLFHYHEKIIRVL